MKTRGFSLTELLVFTALFGVALVATAYFSLPMLGRELARSAAYDVESFLRLARTEALSRNRDCHFVIDSANRTLQVFDSNGTSTTTDDELLHNRVLPRTIGFARPDAGAPITFSSLGGTSYGISFKSDGAVDGSTGEVVLFGGDHYVKLEVFAAGGTQKMRWNGSSWKTGA